MHISAVFFNNLEQRIMHDLHIAVFNLLVISGVDLNCLQKVHFRSDCGAPRS